MEILLVVAAIAYLLLPLFLLFSFFNLKKDVRSLQEKLNITSLEPTATMSPKTIQASSVAAEINWFSQLTKWLKVDWPMKLGAFLLLLGFAWLTTYAFMNNWVGPVGRISMGIVGGLLIILLGEWRSKISVPQSGVLVALGASTILVTIYAARSVYDFFTPNLALIFMALVVVFVAFSSVKHRLLSLAGLGLSMGGIVPLLVDVPQTDFLSVFSYLFVLCAGTLWVVGITGWRGLNNLALAVVALHSFLYLQSGHTLLEENLLTEFIFACAFALLFFVSNLARMLKNQITSHADVLTAVGNGLLFLYWINETISEEWKSLVTAAAMLVLFTAAYALLKKTALKESIYAYGVVAFLFLVAATRFEIEDTTIFILAYTLEATAVIATAFALIKDQKGIQVVTLLLMPALLGSIGSLHSYDWKQGVLHPDFFVLLVTALSTLSLGLYFYKKKWAYSTVLFALGGFYAIAWIWLSSDALITNPAMGVMSALTLYTLAGLSLNLGGSAKEVPVARTAGALLIGLVVIRLLAVDVWDMDITGKIITFFVIGSLLLSTAFLSKKLAHS